MAYQYVSLGQLWSDLIGPALQSFINVKGLASQDYSKRLSMCNIIHSNFKLTYWPCLELASVILTNYISSIPLLLIMESLPEVLSFVVSKALMSRTPGKQLSWSNGDIIGMKLVWKPEKPPHNLGHRSPTVYVNVHASHSQAPSHLPS